MDRRKFIKNSVSLSASLPLLGDPFLAALANESELTEKQLCQRISFDCHLLRESDLVNLHFYFFNLRAKRNRYVAKLDRRVTLGGYDCELDEEDEEKAFISEVTTSLERIDREKDAYVIVRFAQQHISERLFTLDDNESPDESTIAESFAVGYSYYSFKIPETGDIPLDDKNLLRWAHWQLVDLNELITLTEARELQQGTNYPISIDPLEFNVPEELMQRNSPGVPGTLLELPYRMYLSPARPYNLNGEIRYKSRHVDDSRKSELWSYRGTLLNTLWTSRLSMDVFEDMGESGFKVSERPAEFKVLAFDESDRDISFDLLPDPRINIEDRKRIANATLLPGDRNVKSGEFSLSALGASANLHYENQCSTADGLVSWIQDIRLGRDTYIEVQEEAVDCRSGLKVLISRIGERKVVNGISFIRKRFYIEPKEIERVYDKNAKSRNPFQKIIANYSGKYFSAYDYGDTDDAIQTGYFHLLNEGGENLNELLKLEYTGIDHDGNYINFQLDSFVILKKFFNQNENNPSATWRAQKYAIDNIEGNNQFFTHFGEQKVAFDDSASIVTVKPGEANQKVCYLPVEEIKFYFDLRINREYDWGADRRGEYCDAPPPYVFIAPKLLFARVYIPQLEDLSPGEAKQWVSYSDKFFQYKNQGHAWNGIVLNLVASQPATRWLGNGQPDLDESNLKLTFNKKTIENPFSKNYKQAGGVANPGVNIDAISNRSQSLLFNESTPVGETGKRTGQFNLTGDRVEIIQPGDILRAIDAELFGGISLKDILQEFIPIDAAPVLDAVDQVSEAVKYIDGVKDEYESRLREFQDIVEQIKILEKSLPIMLKDGIQKGGRLLEKIAKSELEKARIEIYQQVKVSGESIREKMGLYQKEIANEIQSKIYAVEQTRYQSLKARFAVLMSAYESNKEDLNVEIRQAQDAYKAIESIINTPRERRRLEQFVVNYFVFEFLSRFSGEFGQLLALRNRLSEIANELDGQLNNFISSQIEYITKACAYVDAFIKAENEKIVRELDELDRQLDPYRTIIMDKVEKAYRYYEEMYFRFVYYQELYSRLHLWNDDVDKLSEALGINFTRHIISQQDLDLIKDSVKIARDDALSSLRQRISAVENAALEKIYNEIYPQVVVIYDSYQEFKSLEMQLKNQVDQGKTEILQKLDALVRRYIKKKHDLEQKLNQTKDVLENFVKRQIEKKEEQLNKKYVELKQAYTEDINRVNAIVAEINAAREFIKKLKSIDRKTLNYSWETSHFRRADLGFISFVPKSSPPTKLTIKNESILYFDLKNLTSKPTIERVEYKNDTRVSNFDINFLKVLNIAFSYLEFISGSQVKDKFDVDILDVDFEGPLSFVRAFQQYLATFDKGLKLDVNAKGATLSYLMPIPDIQSGAFNFAMARFFVGMHLPFDSKKPLAVRFGLNSPQEMFLISVGVFGGRGCFQIEAQPKRGITELLLVLEYGGVVFISLGAARGIVYLFAGIYLRKRNDFVELRGYVTCGGAMDIAGLITVSANFYIGVEGRGKTVSGVSRYSYRIKLGPFFKITVRVEARQRITGPAEDNPSSLLSSSTYAKSQCIEDQHNSRDLWEAYFASYYEAAESAK